MPLNTVALLLDIGVCAALMIAAILGAKRGLINSLMGIAIIVLALVGAGWCASRFTEPVTLWLTPGVVGKMTEYLQEGVGAETSAVMRQLMDQVRSLLGQAPQQDGGTILYASVLPLVRTVVHAAIYVVSFFLLLVLLWLVSRPLKLAAKLPVVRGLDGLGGGALGLISGVIVVFVALWAVQKLGWISDELLQHSHAAKYFAHNRLIGIFASL